MSGSSGGYMPSFKGNTGIDCVDISLTTNLSSPDATVVGKLKNGDTLEIAKLSPKAIGVYNLNGELAGALITASNTKLLECMEKGVEFEGTVIKILGGNCQILIKAK